MNNDDPVAYFITWTIYGTHLQGDLRGWRKGGHGHQTSKPLLERWHRNRLKFQVLTLTEAQRRTVEDEIRRLSEFRKWHLWATSVRSNHVHVAVTANTSAGVTVRDQLKANCTRALREQFEIFVDRPVWTVGGDWQCVKSEDELERVVLYISEAQDRKALENNQ